MNYTMQVKKMKREVVAKVDTNNPRSSKHGMNTVGNSQIIEMNKMNQMNDRYDSVDEMSLYSEEEQNRR